MGLDSPTLTLKAFIRWATLYLRPKGHPIAKRYDRELGR